MPHIVWTGELAGALLFAGVIGTALAHWALVLINRSLPATTTALGLLATPVMGVAASALLLGEAVSLSLLAAMAMILGGIGLGTVAFGRGIGIVTRKAVADAVRNRLRRPTTANP